MFKQLSRVRRAAVPGLRTAAPVSSPPVASTSSAATRNVGSKATSQSSNGISKTTHLQSQSQSRKLSTTSPASRNASAVKASANPHIPSASASEDLLQVTTLPNGVRVATDGTPGHFVAAGVYVGAGSRFEWEGNSGSSHMIDRLAYKSTTNRTGEQITNEIETLGGQFLASSSREVIMYQASSYTHSLPSVLSLLSDTVLHARMSDEELETQRQSCAWELAEIHSKPEMILPELLYEVAFQNNTLGNPLLIQEDKLPTITAETVKDFRRTWFRPERIVVAGAGIPHNELLQMAQEHFGKLNAATSLAARGASSSTSAARNIPTHLLQSNTPSSSSSTANKPTGTARYATAASDLFLSENGAPSFEALSSATPLYTGGAIYDPSRPDLEFSHLYVGYEGLSIHDPDVYALATLQMLLGGGSSFSAGGPGKGMYSRLYTSLLNRYHDVEHASAFHHCYQDSGLFAMCISVNHGFVQRAPILVAEQLDSLMDTSSRKGLTTNEVSRAKNQLKSSLVMALESRMVQVEDLGRQVLAHGHKVPIEKMLASIDAVTLPDLQRVARRIFRPWNSPDTLLPGEVRTGEPSILATGQIERLGDVRATLKRYGLAP